MSLGRPYVISGQMDVLPLCTTSCVELGFDELAVFVQYCAFTVMCDINYRSSQVASENQTRKNNLMPFTFGGDEIKEI
jgi:hypothetical protein